MKKCVIQILLLLSALSAQAVLFSVTTSDNSSAWTGYSVYQPEIIPGVVVDTDNNTPNLRYNHCASTAFYSNQWYTVWNANTVEAEGQYGQLIYLSTSTDFTNWTTPEVVFSSSNTCINPLSPDDLGTMMQWQPNLQTVGSELWCTWSENGADFDRRGTFFSRLTSPAGKWENHEILLTGEDDVARVYPLFDGIYWRCFPTQNPTVLSSGRVLAPVTMRERYGAFDTAQKRDAVIYTDDNGASWTVSELIELPAAPTAQWEPSVYELTNGTVAMVSRRIDKTEIEADEVLLYATSSDSGETWSDHEVISLETLSSRMHVLDTGGRFSMLYNDHRNGDTSRSKNVDRYNLSLFTSMTGTGTDWIPGISLTHNLYGVAYPQMYEKDNALYVVTSQGNSRSIHSFVIDEKPGPALHYIHPRHLANSRPDIRDGMLAFDYKQLVKSKWNMNVGTGNFSMGATIAARDKGTIFDGRAGGKGMVAAIKPVGDECALSCTIIGPGTFSTTNTFPWGSEAYIGFSCWNGTTLRLNINGTTEDFPLTSSADLSNGEPLFFGQIQLTNSALQDYYGLIKDVQLFDRALSDAEHTTLQSGGTISSGQQLHLNASTFDDPAQFTIDPDETFEDTVYGANTKRVRGQGSAAVEVLPHDLNSGNSVLLRFNYKTGIPQTNIVLCTVGDADDALRVELTAEGTIITRDASGTRELAAHQAQVYTDIDILINSGGTTVTANNRSSFIPRPFNPARFFIGQGYLEDRAPTTQTFLIRVDAVETRVY